MLRPFFCVSLLSTQQRKNNFALINGELMKTLLLLAAITLAGNVFAKTTLTTHELQQKYGGVYVGVYSDDFVSGERVCKVNIVFNGNKENTYRGSIYTYYPLPGDGDMFFSAKKLKVLKDKIILVDRRAYPWQTNQEELILNGQQEIVSIHHTLNSETNEVCHGLRKVGTEFSGGYDFEWN